MLRLLSLIALVSQLGVTAFQPVASFHGRSHHVALNAAESEVSFDSLDGSEMKIGIIRTRWNDEHVSNLSDGIKKALKECKVKDDNVFETSVPGSFELPLAASFLARSGTVDAIICCGVLIKGDTMHFEYIADAVSKGIMNVGIQTSMPVVFGVLTCMNEDQVKARSSEGNNHGYDWGKTAVEMALLRAEALGGGRAMGKMGFGQTAGESKSESSDDKKKGSGFF